MGTKKFASSARTAIITAMRIWNVSSLYFIFSLINVFGIVVQTHAVGTRAASIPVSSKELIVLPLGDSITNGFRSTDGNGYRLDLYNELRKEPTNKVTMIGNEHAGTMTENENDGYDGALIAEIAEDAKASLSLNTTVVLIHAGTNDMNADNHTDTAPQRLGSLIDEIVAACPKAAVLVAQIIAITTADTEARVKLYNAAIPGIVKQRAGAGKHVMLVDMSNALTPADMFDSLHPNDSGYAKMAELWLSGLEQANGLGWLVNSGAGCANSTSNSTAGTSTSARSPASPSKAVHSSVAAGLPRAGGSLAWGRGSALDIIILGALPVLEELSLL